MNEAVSINRIHVNYIKIIILKSWRTAATLGWEMFIKFVMSVLTEPLANDWVGGFDCIDRLEVSDNFFDNIMFEVSSLQSTELDTARFLVFIISEDSVGLRYKFHIEIKRWRNSVSCDTRGRKGNAVSWIRFFKSFCSEISGQLKSLGFIMLGDKGNLELKERRGKKRKGNVRTTTNITIPTWSRGHRVRRKI